MVVCRVAAMPHRAGELAQLYASPARRPASLGRGRVCALRRHRSSDSCFWDFSKPVVVANVLAWPLAYYFAERYIAAFSARMTLTPVPFAAARLRQPSD
jgi:putative ABC transport system permease protein